MLLKKKVFLIVSLLYILYMVVPVVQSLARVELWMVNLATFILLFALYPAAFVNRVALWFGIYALILAIYVLLGKPLTIGIGAVADTKKIFIEYGFFLPTFSIFSILLYLKELRLFRTVGIGGSVLVVISFLYLVPVLLADGNAMREAISMQQEYGMSIPSVPGYTLMHAYIIALPAVLYSTKQTKGVWTFVLWLVLLLLLFVILHTYITTSLLIAVMIIVVAVLYDPRSIVKSIIVCLITLMFGYVLHLSGFFIQVFDAMLDFFADTAVEPKIEGFKYIYLYGDVENSSGHLTGRMDYHDMSWLAFSENFLVGGTSPVGGHSSVLDRLGGMGLLATVPFLMIFIAQARMILRILITAEEKLYYVLGLFAAATLLYQKGLFGQEGWLITMILMPGLILAFRNMVPYGTPQVLVNDNEKRDE